MEQTGVKVCVTEQKGTQSPLSVCKSGRMSVLPVRPPHLPAAVLRLSPASAGRLELWLALQSFLFAFQTKSGRESLSFPDAPSWSPAASEGPATFCRSAYIYD